MKTLNDIRTEYNTLADSEKVSVLYKALCEMEDYNGHSKTHCIANGMGYTTEYGILFTKNK